MISVAPFRQQDSDVVLDFWRSLHPDWAWLHDRERVNRTFTENEDMRRDDYIVRSNKCVIATVFSQCLRRSGWLPTRFLHVEARPGTLSSQWLEPLLEQIGYLDEGKRGIWHVINVWDDFLFEFTPILMSSGFVEHSKILQMEWRGQLRQTIEIDAMLFERYNGGSLEIDQAIVDLHDRLFRQSRLATPLSVHRLWDIWPGQQKREYALVTEKSRLIGFVEWGLFGGAATIKSFAIARSYWGTGLAEAILTWVMKIILRCGHRSIMATTQSNNAASIALQHKIGWLIKRELAITFVRKLQ